MNRQLPFIFLLFLVLQIDTTNQYSISPGDSSIQDTVKNMPVVLQDKPVKIYELHPGDILVKANHNWLPGTAQVYGGKGFGHAALVISGARDTNLLRLLQNTVVFESHSRDVAPEFQVRQAPAYLPGNDFRFASITFGPQNLGYCYCLRPDLNPEQINRLILFVTGQDKGTSCWRAQKKFTEGNEMPETDQQGNWYCSLLIWQAFYTLFGIDLDPNARVMVYPNDLIASDYFNDRTGRPKSRIRF